MCIRDRTKTAYSEYYPNTTSYNVVSGGWAETGYGEVVLNAETPTAKDYAYTKYYGPHYLGAPKGFTWITVSSSDPDVMTATAVTGTDSQGRTCLVVTFQQGTKDGTARIEIDFTVTELRVEAGSASDSQTAYAVSAVSYTHLDVYKRQVVAVQAHMVAAQAVDAKEQNVGSLSHSPSSSYNILSVSYTHLQSLGRRPVRRSVRQRSRRERRSQRTDCRCV